LGIDVFDGATISGVNPFAFNRSVAATRARPIVGPRQRSVFSGSRITSNASGTIPVLVAQTLEVHEHELGELLGMIRVAQGSLDVRRVPLEVHVVHVDVQLLSARFDGSLEREQHVLHTMVEAVEQETRRVGNRRVVVVVDLLEPRRLPLTVRELTGAKACPPVGAVLHPAGDLQSDRVDPDRVREVPVDLVEVQVRRAVVPVVRLVFLPLPQVHRPAVDRLMVLGRVHDDGRHCRGRLTSTMVRATATRAAPMRRVRTGGLGNEGLRQGRVRVHRGKRGLSTIVLHQEELGALCRPPLRAASAHRAEDGSPRSSRR
jgi:hypothetical protein